MTLWRDCPVCGAEALEVACGWDSQGDGPLTQSILECEIIRRLCDCELTEEQETAILESAADDWE